jgi:hypothetical protein
MATRVIRAMRDLGVGVRAAWSAPALIGRRLAPLLQRPSSTPLSRAVDARRAVRASHAMLARLARVYGARWRNTCLYRSVAECLVLRSFGLPAFVVIGVGTGADPADVIAHAWVECEGVQCLSTRGQAELEAFASRAP